MAPPSPKRHSRFLSDAEFRIETQRRAYEYARPMFWPNVGRKYLEFFRRIVSAGGERQEGQPRSYTYGRNRTTTRSTNRAATTLRIPPLAKTAARAHSGMSDPNGVSKPMRLKFASPSRYEPDRRLIRPSCHGFSGGTPDTILCVIMHESSYRNCVHALARRCALGPYVPKVIKGT